MRKGVFYFSAAPVTRQAYKVQQRFSSGKVAMDLLTDAYAASLVLGAVLLWLGVAPALPVVSRLQSLPAWKQWLIRMRAGWFTQLYIGLYALCKPPRPSRIWDGARSLSPVARRQPLPSDPSRDDIGARGQGAAGLAALRGPTQIREGTGEWGRPSRRGAARIGRPTERA